MQVLLLKWNEKPDPELDPRSLSTGGARPAGHLVARLHVPRANRGSLRGALVLRRRVEARGHDVLALVDLPPAALFALRRPARLHARVSRAKRSRSRTRSRAPVRIIWSPDWRGRVANVRKLGSAAIVVPSKIFQHTTVLITAFVARLRNFPCMVVHRRPIRPHIVVLVLFAIEPKPCFTPTSEREGLSVLRLGVDGGEISASRLAVLTGRVP